MRLLGGSGAEIAVLIRAAAMSPASSSYSVSRWFAHRCRASATGGRRKLRWLRTSRLFAYSGGAVYCAGQDAADAGKVRGKSAQAGGPGDTLGCGRPVEAHGEPEVGNVQCGLL